MDLSLVFCIADFLWRKPIVAALVFNPQSVIRSDKECKDGNRIVFLVDFGLMTNLGLRADW